MYIENKRSSHSERRYFPRWKVDKEVIYRLNHLPAEKSARTLDLSCRGACILSSEPLLPAQRVALSIIFNKVTIAHLNGRVAWIRHFPKQNEAGIAFDEIDEETQNMILEHAFNFKKDDLVNYWFKGWDGAT